MILHLVLRIYIYVHKMFTENINIWVFLFLFIYIHIYHMLLPCSPCIGFTSLLSQLSEYWVLGLETCTSMCSVALYTFLGFSFLHGNRDPIKHARKSLLPSKFWNRYYSVPSMLVEFASKTVPGTFFWGEAFSSALNLIS